MENNNLSLNTSITEKEWSKLVSSLNVTERLSKEAVFGKLAAVYTTLLGESVTSLQAVYFLYAQLAALGLFFPVTMGLGWRASFFLVLGHALRCIFNHKK